MEPMMYEVGLLKDFRWWWWWTNLYWLWWWWWRWWWWWWLWRWPEKLNQNTEQLPPHLSSSSYRHHRHNDDEDDGQETGFFFPYSLWFIEILGRHSSGLQWALVSKWWTTSCKAQTSFLVPYSFWFIQIRNTFSAFKSKWWTTSCNAQTQLQLKASHSAQPTMQYSSSSQSTLSPSLIFLAIY